MSTAIIEYYTFTADGVIPSEFKHQGRYSQITMGSVDARDFGGGTLLIQKSTLNGSRHTIRSITAAEFDTMQDRTLRLELPDETVIYVEMTGSSSPNLYIEHRQQQDNHK
jgi:hypothetical protein